MGKTTFLLAPRRALGPDRPNDRPWDKSGLITNSIDLLTILHFSKQLITVENAGLVERKTCQDKDFLKVDSSSVN